MLINTGSKDKISPGKYIISKDLYDLAEKIIGGLL